MIKPQNENILAEFLKSQTEINRVNIELLEKFVELLEKILSASQEWRDSEEGLETVAEAMTIAPPGFTEFIIDNLKRLGLLPDVPAFVDEAGQSFYTYKQIAAFSGMPVEEIQSKCKKLTALLPVDAPVCVSLLACFSLSSPESFN